MARIEIDPGAGFCFGVEEVISTAETTLRKGETLYGLGSMVHNDEEIKRLEGLGLHTISHEELPAIRDGKVLFRAHGEPPSSYETVSGLGIGLIDGTCPIVLKLQERIRKAYRAMDPEREQMVIFGNREHPETIGLLGQTGGNALVVSSMEDIPTVDPNKKVLLFSQTTMDPEQFREVEKGLKAHLRESVRPAFRSHCTICGQMKKRKPGLRSFARKHDVVVFVSGKNSSNGKMLYEFCRSLNPRTHWISSAEELDEHWFMDAASIGISGATSTSKAQLENIADRLKKFIVS
jgi:4-hydroxy-3-methylbut-2-enyl diphosphate reductase